MKHKALIFATGGLLVATGLWVYQIKRPEAPVDPAITGQGTTVQTMPPAQAPEEALAKAGLLWEPKAADAREAERTTIIIDPAPLRAAMQAAPGSRVSLPLSSHFAPIQGEVVGHAPYEDGTQVSYIRVDGKPAGNLTLQENTAAGFFLGQLYYEDNHPIAYEIRPQGDRMSMTRHPVSNLVCSELDSSHQRVASYGMHGLDSEKMTEALRNEQAALDRARLGIEEGGATTLSAISVKTAAVDEGAGKLTFTVQLSKADIKRTISVNYATVDATAKAGVDYQAVTGTLKFPPRTTSLTIAVPLVNDSDVETSEYFNLKLSAPVNATLATASAAGTINDNDGMPQVSIASNATVNEGNVGQTSVHVTVTLSRAASSPVTVSYASSDGTATAESDYMAASSTLTFNPGVTSQAISLVINGDANVEANESFKLALTSANGAIIGTGTSTIAITNDDTDTTTTQQPPPVNDPNAFQSRPSALCVIYLDMDGQNVTGTQWSSGTIAARGIMEILNADQRLEICKRVAEDYSPFDVNVTNSEAVYLAAPTNRRIRCIITPDNEWYSSSAGGVAYRNSFTWTGDTPCWVFSDNLASTARYIAECCSHEVGHTLGLAHDGRTSPSESYFAGQGDGEVGWAPIMGNGYYKLLTQWSRGEYTYANNLEDDLATITANNGFTYRPDDRGNTSSAATGLTVSGNQLSGAGVLERRDDVDAFSFSTAGGSVTLSAKGPTISQDLDIEIKLYDSTGNMVTSANPPTQTNATITTELPAGTYYLLVSGVGYGDPKASGYSNYATLGQYTIEGTVP